MAWYLRKAIWDNIIEAHNIIDNSIYLKDKDYYIEEGDIDCNGYIETLYSSRKLITVFSEKGAKVLEISYKPKKLCITNCLTRRFESYHLSVADAVKEEEGEAVKTIHHIQRIKDKEVENYLIYDDYERNNFLFYLINGLCELSDFREKKYLCNKELLDGLYNKIVEEKGTDYKIEYEKAIESEQISLIKSYIIDDSRIKNRVVIKNDSNEIKGYRSIIELSLNLFIPHKIDNYIDFGKGERNYMDWEGEMIARRLKLVDTFNSIEIIIESIDEGDENNKWWIFPVYTISQSEEGYEKVYQGSSITLVRDIDIKLKANMELGLILSIFHNE